MSRPTLGPTQHHIKWVLAVKQSGSEANDSPLSNAKVHNECSYTSTPPICLHGVDRETFTFYLYYKKLLDNFLSTELKKIM